MENSIQDPKIKSGSFGGVPPAAAGCVDTVSVVCLAASVSRRLLQVGAS
jgi:hypothetical protein